MIKQLWRWRPNLFAQFFIGVAILLVPLALVVVVFLQALDKHMVNTQQMVLSSYQKNEQFNEFKQLFQSLERATLQNWVLQSEQLSEAVALQWQKADTMLDSQISAADVFSEQSRWQELYATFSATRDELRNSQTQNAQLFVPLRQQINTHGQWLHEHTKKQVTHAQQALADLQQSFIHWLVALVPIVLLFGGGYLWRISSRLSYLSRVIGRLGKGDWDVDIKLTGAKELRELGQKLHWMQQQLQALEQQKDTFLRHVTHELKTPLASMVEGCDLLSEQVVGPINEQQQDVLELISQSTERLRAMIQSLLNYNAIRSRTANPRPCELADLKHQVLEHFADRLALAQQKVNWQCDKKLAMLRLDGELVQMILVQLLSNAIKFSPPGATITVAISQSKSEVELKVCDQGPGISKAEQERLFDAFFQGKAGKSSRLQGSGLGLSIVKECVDQLNGDINIHSVSPKGSCFTLHFNQ
ncbi:sensor histidine kinase [Pseudoalteromonas ruthenica]|uniref:sensor histidine kinase n=1 Tax=Pseudoalteromonas ruthenica TaxID=151081 RepID=UPI0011080079|nr:HAMP domain-containing sensor histidine kinase [Pseudoalteromonas ruthenica]TLX51191.1 sensor histidine kinase [Pseudoalteromonas ruthenica]